MKRLLPLLLLLPVAAFAQVTNLTLTTTSSAGRATPTLTWSNPTATSCAATGDAAWAAASKPVSGTVTLAAVAPPNARSYTLTCVFPGDTTATVSWTAPTTNTDGSALTNLAGFNVYRRVGSQDVGSGEMTPVRDPTATSRVFSGLGTGTHYFGVEAVNADGVPSVMSNIAGKPITAGATDSETVSIAFPGTTVIVVR